MPDKNQEGEMLKKSIKTTCYAYLVAKGKDKMASSTGLEPVIYPLGGDCIIQLCYEDVAFDFHGILPLNQSGFMCVVGFKCRRLEIR